MEVSPTGTPQTPMATVNAPLNGDAEQAGEGRIGGFSVRQVSAGPRRTFLSGMLDSISNTFRRLTDWALRIITPRSRQNQAEFNTRLDGVLEMLGREEHNDVIEARITALVEVANRIVGEDSRAGNHMVRARVASGIAGMSGEQRAHLRAGLARMQAAPNRPEIDPHDVTGHVVGIIREAMQADLNERVLKIRSDYMWAHHLNVGEDFFGCLQSGIEKLLRTEGVPGDQIKYGMLSYALGNWTPDDFWSGTLERLPDQSLHDLYTNCRALIEGGNQRSDLPKITGKCAEVINTRRERLQSDAAAEISKLTAGDFGFQRNPADFQVMLDTAGQALTEFQTFCGIHGPGPEDGNSVARALDHLRSELLSNQANLSTNPSTVADERLVVLRMGVAFYGTQRPQASISENTQWISNEIARRSATVAEEYRERVAAELIHLVRSSKEVDVDTINPLSSMHRDAIARYERLQGHGMNDSERRELLRKLIGQALPNLEFDLLLSITEMVNDPRFVGGVREQRILDAAEILKEEIKEEVKRRPNDAIERIKQGYRDEMQTALSNFADKTPGETNDFSKALTFEVMPRYRLLQIYDRTRGHETGAENRQPLHVTMTEEALRFVPSLDSLKKIRENVSYLNYDYGNSEMVSALAVLKGAIEKEYAARQDNLSQADRLAGLMRKNPAK